MTPVDEVNQVLQERLFAFVNRVFIALHPEARLQKNWHILAICKALQDVFDGTTPRLLITVPPRHLKSICTTIGFCAWALGRDPSLKLMVASYGTRLAQEHSALFRQVVEADWYQNLFPAMQIAKRGNQQLRLQTTANGGRLAVGRGGAITGFGADILIVDDLNKADEDRSMVELENAYEFFTGSLLTRLNDKRKARVIVIQQRLHELDLAGHLLMSGDYKHLNFPAIAEVDETFDLGTGRILHRKSGDVLFSKREPKEVLDRLRREMGPYKYGAQYQQNPTPEDAATVRWDWLQTYEEDLDRRAFVKVVQSWDTAETTRAHSDPSVCITFGYKGGTWHILDIHRDKIEIGDLKPRIKSHQRQWEADVVVIERNSATRHMIRELRDEMRSFSQVMGFTPKESKEERLYGQVSKLVEGLVKIPCQAPWLTEFRRELLGFPRARHDDQVDALSQFLAHISKSGYWRHPGERRRRNIERRQSMRG